MTTFKTIKIKHNLSDFFLAFLTKLASVSASRLSLMGLLATEDPSNIGRAEHNALLKINKP